MEGKVLHTSLNWTGLKTDEVPGAACVDAPLLVIVLVHDTVIVVVGEEIVAREVGVDVGALGQGQPVPRHTVYK